MLTGYRLERQGQRGLSRPRNGAEVMPDIAVLGVVVIIRQPFCGKIRRSSGTLERSACNDRDRAFRIPLRKPRRVGRRWSRFAQYDRCAVPKSQRKDDILQRNLNPL